MISDDIVKKTSAISEIPSYGASGRGLCALMFFLFILSFPFSGEADAESGHYASIGPRKANLMLHNGAIDLVLDVRTPWEFTGKYGKIRGARLIPIQNLARSLKILEKYKNKTVLVYCEVGVRSLSAARFLARNGFSSVLDLKGGIVSWRRAGYPTAR